MTIVEIETLARHLTALRMERERLRGLIEGAPSKESELSRPDLSIQVAPGAAPSMSPLEANRLAICQTINDFNATLVEAHRHPQIQERRQ